MSQRLPSIPNLDHLKKQAKDVLRLARHRRPRWRLADAQHAIARGYGFATWTDLKRHVEAIRPEGQLVKDNQDGTFDFHVHVVCSAGTYVRTLAEDFGKRLSVGAHLAELRRTRVGDFTVTNAVTLQQLKTSFGEEAIGTMLLRPSAALSRLPFVHLSGDDVRRARNGMEVKVGETSWADGEKVKMCDAGDHLIAIGDYDATTKRLHPSVVLA